MRMPRPASSSHKGPSHKEFLIAAPRLPCHDDDPEREMAVMDHFAECSVARIFEDDSDVLELRALPGLVRELRTLILADFKSILMDTHAQFLQHNELLKSQASMTEILLQNAKNQTADLISKDHCSKTFVETVRTSKEYCSTAPGESWQPLQSDRQLRPSQDILDALRSDIRDEANTVTQRDVVNQPQEATDLPQEYTLGSYERNNLSTVNNAGSLKSDDTEDEFGPAVSRKSSSLIPSSVVKYLGMDGEKKRVSTDSSKRVRAGIGIINPHMQGLDLVTPCYKVETYYHASGFFQAIAQSETFQNFTLLVIIANAIFIGVDADHNDAKSISDAHIGFQICEYTFFIYFSAEWLVRFGAFQSKMDCLRDMWFKFDTALVVMMVVENTLLPLIMAGAGVPIPTSMIKLVRLLRLARMARLMRALPELVAMIKGVRMAFRAVGSALLLLLLMVYIFGVIVFVLLRDEIDVLVDAKGNYYADTYFGNLPLTMWTLLVDGAFMDSYGVVTRKLLDSNQYLAFAVMVFFVLASALTVMNMLIGVLCEVVTDVAASEKEAFDVNLIKETLLVMLLHLDSNGNGLISMDEMQSVLEDHKSLDVLRSLNVPPSYLIDHVQMFFDDSEDGNLQIADIMDLILVLRGDRVPTMKEMLHVQNFQRWKIINYMRRQEQSLVARVDKVLGALHLRLLKADT